MTSHLRLLAGGLCTAATLVLAPSAVAAGGDSIASAPGVTFGEPQFGNTSIFQVPKYDKWREFWSLALVSGDQVTIQWRLQAEPDGDFDGRLAVLAATVNDFNLSGSYGLAADTPDATGRSELTFSAPSTAAYPMMVETYDELGVGYDFTAYVQHATRLSLRRVSTLARTGTLRVGVRAPDGAAIDDAALTVTLRARYGRRRSRVVGSATVTDGAASIRYSAPASYARHRVKVWAVATGADYATEASDTLVVRLT